MGPYTGASRNRFDWGGGGDGEGGGGWGGCVFIELPEYAIFIKLPEFYWMS